MAIQHYEGKLGTFDYDDEMFTLRKTKYTIAATNTVKEDEFLEFNDSYEGPISLPKGITSTRSMFACCKNLERCWFEDFDTSNVTNMGSMFYHCLIPNGFSLGDKFDTSNVTNMSAMFQGCEMRGEFSLGDKFDTSQVMDMSDMFADVHLPNNFTLGDKFDTSQVTNMNKMFDSAYIPDNFTLGDKFDTSNVRSMVRMFGCCEMSNGFSLGDKFDTSNVENMRNMFRDMSLPVDFTLGDKFDTSKVENMDFMFEDCIFKGSQFKFGDKFIVNPINCEEMFNNVTIAGKPGKIHINEDGKIDVFRPMSEVEMAVLKEAKEIAQMTTEDISIDIYW